METIKIEIVNPKAKKILTSLVELKLIKIKKENSKADFTTLLKKIRTNSSENISIEEITQEVEEVRSKRYENL